MSTLDYLSDLRTKGIVITLAPAADGQTDQLKVSAPKGAIDNTIKTELGARKEEILEFLQKAAATQGQTLPPIKTRTADDPLVLSAAQDRVWKLHRLSPDASTMNIPVTWELRGPIDLEMLDTSLATLSQRQEMLRARFPERDGQPDLVIDPEGTVQLERLSVSAATGSQATDAATANLDEARAAAISLATDFAARPFDLAAAVARAAIIDIADDHQILVVVFHQIIFDWGAANPLVADLSAIYAALGRQQEPSLQPLEVGYVDYSLWQREWLASDSLDVQRRYWAEQLERPYRSLALPTRTNNVSASDDSADNVPTSNVSSNNRAADETTRPQEFNLPVATVEQLKALSQGAGATLYMTLLGAWQTLLAGYGEQDDAIVFSLLSLNRPELKKVIGLFANPLPIRLDLAGDPTSVQVVERVSTAALGAFSHQDIPLETVIEQFRADSGGGQSGPFQSLFIFQHEPTPDLVLGDAEAELLTVGDHAAAFGLRLFAEDNAEGLRGWLEYDATLFSEGTAKQLLDHYVSLLEAMVERPDEPISALLPLTADDRAQALAAVEQWPAAAEQAYVAPRTEQETELAEMWSRLFDRKVGIDDDFFALGGHSLLAVSMFADIEASTGRNLPLATLFEAPSVRALAEVLQQDDWKLEWTSLVPIKPTGSRRALFCVAALGDEIIQFGELSELLDAEQPFYGLQQGLDRTDEIRTTIPEIAAHYLSEIRAVQPHGPYLIAGYCFGGLIAYEMAQQLRADGEVVSPVLMIEAEAPGGIYLAPATKAERLKRAVGFVGANGPVATAKYVRKRLGKIWRWVIWTRLRHYLHRGFDKMNVELPETLKDILQINAQAADDYAPIMKPFEGDICILRAESMTPGYIYADQLGWDGLVKGHIESHWIPGDHEGIWKSPNVQHFAKQLESVIDESNNAVANQT